MGGDKGGGETTVVQQGGSSTQERTPTPEEQRINELDLELREANQAGLMATQGAGLDLSQMLLSGSNNLPGYMQGMQGGISPEVTQGIVDESLQDVDARMGQHGLLDSGTRASISARTSGDIRRASEEFNIGNKLNLLNLALTGQAQVQQPVLGFSNSVGNRLQSLGPTTKSFSGSSSTGPGGAFGGGGASGGWTAF